MNLSYLSSRKASMTTEWKRVTPADPSIPSFSVYDMPIEKSQQDDRDYRIIRLDNGLEATLIHDATADKAAASLDVAVGHLSDPDDMPGLAHFCEHLLFMGTEQFPRENEYSEFLAKNNGSSNAYTSVNNTNYYFNVATPALAGALARFSGFFHCPLFSPSCTSRELNAVDSEHKKNHQSDLWRVFQLSKHLSKEGHAWRKFGSGNRESLSQAGKDLKAQGKLEAPATNGIFAPSPIPSRIASPAPSVASSSSDNDSDGGAVGKETRRRVVEWWTKEYCASRMHLCILGKESLGELSELVSSLFSPIPNRGVDPLPMFTEHPMGPEQLGTLVPVQTIMTVHALEFSFPLEYQVPFWRHKPSEFISHFVGHEGPGSLHSYLKNKGWITGLSSGPQNLGRGFGMFKVTVYLTADGFKEYRNVILATAKYFALLRESTFAPFHQKELVTLAKTRFRFQEKRRPDDYATRIAERMARGYPRDLLLSAPLLVWDWDDYKHEGGGEEKIREYLESFRLEKGRVILMAQKGDLESVGFRDHWETEPWYGTEYRVERFDEDFVKQANGVNDIPQLFLPGPNEFIPTNLDVDKREVVKPAGRPHLIRETPLSVLWHKKDDRFWVPKGFVVIDLRSPYGNNSPRDSVLTRLYSDLVTDSLTEFSYDADLAGITYSFLTHASGLYVSMNGYNDKVIVLVQHVLERVKQITVRPERLIVMKEEIKKTWENFFLGQSYQLSEYYGRYMLTERQWTIHEKLQELTTVTPEEVQSHIKKFLSQVNIRILVTGNMFKEEAIKIAEVAEQGLGLSGLPPSQLNERGLLLPEGCNYTWTSIIPNPNQSNSALTYFCHYGSVSDQRLRVVAALLNQILSEPTFNTLRTKEQLGYIVSCSGWSLSGGGDIGVRIVVQSEKTPGHLEDRVEAHLSAMKTYIEEMTPEVFQEQKGGLEKKWRESYKNLMEEGGHFMLHISTGHLDFLRAEKDANLLKDITKEDVLSLFMSNVHPSSKTRSKLSVQMRSQTPRPQKVSAQAAEQFTAIVRAKMPDLDESAWKDLGEGDHNVPDFQAHWVQALQGRDGLQELVNAMVVLMAKYPVQGEGEDAPRPGVEYITDLKAFRAGLTPSTDLGPMVQWGDLPAPRL